MSTHRTPQEERARDSESAAALARLERRAAEFGVRPFDAGEWLAEEETDRNPEEAQREVDEFLGLLRGWRDTPSSRSVG
jgi:hypothetical protein